MMKSKNRKISDSKQQLWQNVVEDIRDKQNKRFLKCFRKETQPNGKYKQFIRIPFELIDNPKFRNGFMTKKRFRTYLYLSRKVIRGHYPNDSLDIFYNYWLSGELAASLPLDKIAADLNLSKSTVSDHIRQLEKDGVITVDRIEASESHDGKPHLIFILGTCTHGFEHWFIEDVFGSCDKKLP
jgi:DNA-binding MarR family transcriptional regulator